MAKNTVTAANAEIFAPVAATKAPRRRAAKKTAVAAAVAAAVTAAPAQAQAPAIIPAAAPAQAQAPAIIPAAPAQAQAPAIIPAAAPAQAQAPAIIPAAAPAQVQAAGLTWQKTLPRAKGEGTNLFSFRHGIEFSAIDGKIRFSRAQLALSMDDIKGAFGANFAKWIKTNVKSWPARFVTESGPSRNYVWCFADILKIAGKTTVRKALRAALTKYYNSLNG